MFPLVRHLGVAQSKSLESQGHPETPVPLNVEIPRELVLQEVSVSILWEERVRSFHTRERR